MTKSACTASAQFKNLVSAGSEDTAPEHLVKRTHPGRVPLRRRLGLGAELKESPTRSHQTNQTFPRTLALCMEAASGVTKLTASDYWVRVAELLADTLSRPRGGDFPVESLASSGQV
jgi:hypothetical protein